MVQYQADTRMDIFKNEDWEESNQKIGQLVHWKTTCSGMGASGTECVSYIRFGTGIDKIKEIIELACSFGIIEKSGAWYTIPSHGEEKYQGQEKLYNFISSNPDVYNSIESSVKEIISDI